MVEHVMVHLSPSALLFVYLAICSISSEYNMHTYQTQLGNEISDMYVYCEIQLGNVRNMTYHPMTSYIKETDMVVNNSPTRQ